MLCHTQATMYKMGQRVLAENAGVMEVRYELPNKHYIPVDMKYIGVDNTTAYVVPIISWFGRNWKYVWFGGGGATQWTEGTNPFLEISSASCCGAEVDGECDEGAFFFLDRSLFLSSSVTPSSVMPRGPGQLTRPPLFLIFLLLTQTKRGGFHPSGRTKVREIAAAASVGKS